MEVSRAHFPELSELKRVLALLLALPPTERLQFAAKAFPNCSEVFDALTKKICGTLRKKGVIGISIHLVCRGELSALDSFFS